ncbi:hypothetical protein BH10PLA2_BH10PLA2_11170 [soil metagenome]
MSFRSLASPRRVMRNIEYILRYWRDRALVDRCLDERAFLDRCLAEKDRLEFYLNTRDSLGSFNIEEGTVLFPEEHQFLKGLVETANTLPGPIVEIGTLFGFTTTRFAVWRKSEKKIITVDNYTWNPWQLTPEIHRKLTRQFLAYLVETGQVELVEMDQNKFYESYRGESPSLVFFDSIHDYEATKADIAWARKVGAKIIAGHDYHEAFPGVVRAVTEAGGLGARAGVVWTLKSEYVQSPRSAA